MIGIQKILKNEESWCEFMGYRNPYLDPYDHHITSSTVTGDQTAYRRFPENNRVYDKLWVAQTQGLLCGKLEDLRGKESGINYPIFIKPRWGHLSASSKNCYNIKSESQLLKYINYSDMMWSEFIDGTEGMTDFLLLNGRIVYQLTYIYSDEQNGFTDVWKYVSPKTPAPPNIMQFVRDNIRGHTGFVNVQYRLNKIIEVGLRPARSGMYIIGANCPALSKNIYNVIDRHFWDDSLESELQFQPFYVYKCYSRVPIVYVWPQKIIDSLMPIVTDMPLYEYYFEPVNNEGVVFFQFMHKTHESGLRIKKGIEFLFILSQIIFIILFFMVIYSLYSLSSNYKYYILIAFIVIWLTRFLNPLYVNYNVYKAYRQVLFPSNSMTTPKEFDDATKKKTDDRELTI